MKFNLQIEFSELEKVKGLMIGCINFANMLGANCSVDACKKFFDDAKVMKEAEYYRSPMIEASATRGSNPTNPHDGFINLKVEVKQELVERIADVIGDLGASFAIPAALHLLGFGKSIKNSFKVIGESFTEIAKMAEIPEEGIRYFITNKKFPIGDTSVEYTALWKYDGFNKPYIFYFHSKDEMDDELYKYLRNREGKNIPSIERFALTKNEASDRLKAIGIKADVFGDEKEKEKEEDTNSKSEGFISMDQLEKECDNADSDNKKPSSWEEFAINIDK